VFVLVALCVLLYAFHKTRPSSVRVRARVTRWVDVLFEVRK
jgi:hypothetical protein